MPKPRSPFVFAIAFASGFIIPQNSPAAVAPSMPENVVVSKMGDYGHLVFILFVDGQFEKGFLLDPKTAGQSGDVRLPDKGLPTGKLSLLGVPRALAEKSKNAPDPAWLTDAAPGLVRVTGVIHNYPVEKHSALHQYELEKMDDGLRITLLNPDVLTPYPPEIGRSPMKPPMPYLWLGLAGAVTVLIAGVVVFWILKRRASHGASSP